MKKINFNYSKELISNEEIKKVIQEAKSKFSLFQKNIREINLTEEDIIKYASSILTSIDSYYKHSKNKNIPIMVLEKDDDFNTLELKVLLKPPKKIENQKIILEGINKDIWFKTDFKPKMTIEVANLVKCFLQSIKDKKYQSFIVIGPAQCGKTSLITLLAKRFYNDNKSVIYLNWNQFISKWKLSFNLNKVNINVDTNYFQIFNSALNYDLLVLDDFAKPKLGEWERESVFLPIIKNRKDNNLMTIIISDLSYEEIKARSLTNKKLSNKHILSDFKLFILNSKSIIDN